MALTNPDGSEYITVDLRQQEGGGNSEVELLQIDPENWRGSDFRKIELSKVMTKLFREEVMPEDALDCTIGDHLYKVIDQLRKQKLECETAVSLINDGRFLLQVSPTIGTAHSVNNAFVDPPEGRKVFEIHNHPIYMDSSTGERKSYPFFSPHDLVWVFHRGSYNAKAVVFNEGTVVLAKTPESLEILNDISQQTKRGKWGWVPLGIEIVVYYERRSTD